MVFPESSYNALKTVLFIIYFAIGLVIGYPLLQFGMRTLFVFRAEESLSSYLSIIGLFSTLPLVIISLFLRKTAATLLFLAGILTAVGSGIIDYYSDFYPGEIDFYFWSFEIEGWFDYLWIVVIPIIILAGLLSLHIYITRLKKSQRPGFDN